MKNKIITLHQPSKFCKRYWLINPFIGCSSNCLYCYLRNAAYNSKMPKLTDRFKLFELQKELRAFLSKLKKNTSLVYGSFQDSFERTAFLRIIVKEVLASKHGHLISWTKKPNLKKLSNLDVELNGRLSVVISINPQKHIKELEFKTYSLKQRLKEAKKLQDNGCKIRFQIAPLIPPIIINKKIFWNAWNKRYFNLIKTIKKHGLIPKRITLSALCLYEKPLSYLRRKLGINHNIIQHFIESKKEADERFRLPENIRIRMYSKLIQYIIKEFKETEVSICLEPKKVHKKIKTNLKLNISERKRVLLSKCNDLP